jgi:uncharacterized protein (TIGR02145 family)
MRIKAVVITLVCGIILVHACNKIKKVMLVSTGDATELTITTSSINGSVIDLGNGAASYGHCYGTTAGVTVDGSKTSLGIPSEGDFTSHLTGLTPGTKYYYRAYLSNGQETAYGEEKSFNTVGIVVPSLSTTTATDIKQTSVSSGGNITNDGGAAITDRGVCWGTAHDPLVTGNHTSDGSGNGSFTSSVTGLSPNTTYYLKAYAKNSAGTGYGNEVSFITKQDTIVKDIDNNTYKIITAGTQVWMAENLKTTHYNDGTEIPLVTDNSAWSNLTGPGYCWFNNNMSTYKPDYGALYNWFVTDSLSTGGKNVCPVGWHVPSDAEWTLLVRLYGDESVAGGMLKESGTTHWDSPNTGATNASLFTAVAAGYRHYNGTFASFHTNGYWWSATPYNSSTAWRRFMYNSSAGINRAYLEKNCGFSIRCIKN